MRFLKCFLIGMAGAIAALVASFIFVSQFSDFRAKAETYGWMAQLEGVQDSIAREAIKQKSLVGIGKSADLRAFRQARIEVFEVLDSGVIVVRGGREGRVVLLIPSLIGETVTWRCIGGPARSVPSKCENSKAPPKPASR